MLYTTIIQEIAFIGGELIQLNEIETSFTFFTQAINNGLIYPIDFNMN
jgi:hypothetical protein